MEHWNEIEGFPYYQVSNFGKVKSLKFGKERILKPSKMPNGYLHVCLFKDGKPNWRLIHRLVAEAFIPNPNSLPCVNHKDENKKNNHVENLEWCDVKYNTNYGTRNERVAKAETNHPQKSKAVLQLSLDGTFVKEWPSAMEIQRQLGFRCGNISHCCLGGRYKTAYGFIWKYKNDEQN